MIPAQVDNLCISLLQFFEDKANKAGVFFIPSAVTRETPAVDDISIQDELLTMRVLEEVVYLLDLTVLGPQVDIREEDGLVAERCLFHSDGGSTLDRAKAAQANRQSYLRPESTL